VTLLADGRIEIEGRMPWSSNGTFLCSLTAAAPASPASPASPAPEGEAAGGGADSQAASGAAIYKPFRAERPLWDFPDGLYRREVAAYELAVALDWDMVPQTVERHDAPLGLGSLQRFVNADFEQHYFTLLEEEAHHPALRRMAIFDVLANNADRKGGHCLIDDAGHIWGIDHGLCFHTAHKLRTVIWDFAGQDIGDDLVADIAGFVERGLSPALRHLLLGDEAEALLQRARALLARPRFPQPRTDHPYPWPLV
jgi:uncharacterized repeat protein (TIGR03843 family)